jgi:hypothetical protein
VIDVPWTQPQNEVFAASQLGGYMLAGLIQYTKQYTKPIAGLAALSVVAACSGDLTGGNRHPVQLSVTSKSSVAASANRVAADLVVGNAGSAGELTLKQVQLVFGKIELDRTGTADCIGEAEHRDGDNDLNDDDHGDGEDHSGPGSSNSGPGSNNSGRDDDGDCEDVFRDPLLIDLRGDALISVINVPLPAGTFSELEAKLEPARARFVDFNNMLTRENPDLVGKSVRVEFTLGSSPTPLVFTSNVRAKLEMEFDDGGLVINNSTENVTINIDVRNWFVTSTGAVLDPRDPANRFRIEQNIRRSFHAFEDNDRHGDDDHGGHGGDR